MFKCYLCEDEYNNAISLCKHWRRTHNESNEKLYKLINKISLDEVLMCKCGCRNKVKFLGIERGYREYSKGHIARIKNNWGHNKKASENSLNKRRKMIEDGTWKPFVSNETGEHWSKGLTKETDERIAKKTEKMMNDTDKMKQMSDRWKQYWKEGKFYTKFGPEHSQWKGGISSLGATCRANNKLYKEWKYPLLKAAKFSCEKCNDNFHVNKKVKLDIHHDKETFSEILKRIAKEYNWNCEITTDIDNTIQDKQALKLKISNAVVRYHINNNVSGVVLCRNCHKEIHKSYNFHDNDI